MSGTGGARTEPAAARAPGGASGARMALLFALADDELVLGHRHAQWTGVAPHLEEDLALSSIAQDELGHALVWYRLAADLDLATGPDLDPAPDPDRLALGRSPEQYRNAILVERPNGDWAYTIARQYCYDTAEAVRLEVLADSSWREVAAATVALRREERYHLLHASTWIERLAEGSAEARERLAAALGEVYAEAGGLFEALPGEDELVAEGVLPLSHAEQARRWHDGMAEELGRLGLAEALGGGLGGPESVPADLEAGGGLGAGGLGGRHGRHTEDFMDVWEELTGMYRAYPGARW